MFFRMVIQALVRQWKKMIMIAFTIALGASLATAMLNVMFDVGDKVNQELKTYGANIRVVPQTASILNDLYGVEGAQVQYLKEDELGKIKTIFWSFNIVDFAPYLDGTATLKSHSNALDSVNVTGTWYSHHMDLPTGEKLDTGMTAMKTWWTVEGSWLGDDDYESAMVGTELAKRANLHIGDIISLSSSEKGSNSSSFKICGIFDAGGDEDESIFICLKAAQNLFEIGRASCRERV